MTDSPLPAVSIIVPTFQRRAIVCETVSLLDKVDYAGPLEIVVVVDGSTDGTAQALRELDLAHPLRCIEQPNRGLAAARNRGAREAGGEILLFLDDDMLAEPAIVAEHVAAISGGADAAVGRIAHSETSPKGFLTEAIARWEEDCARDMRAKDSLDAFDIFGGNLSITRAAFERVGGFDERFTADGGYGNEDLDFAVKLLDGHRAVYAPDALSRQHYAVTPAEYIERGRKLGRADALFFRRHPDLVDRLLHYRNVDHPATNRLLKPLARIPGVPGLLAIAGAAIARVGLAGPWRSSRLLARVLHAVRMVNYWAGARRAGGFPRPLRRGLILCYHAIADHRDDPVLRTYSIPRERFEAHLASLRRRGFAFVSARELLEGLEGRRALPPKPVLISFDDCYTDLLDIARDVLEPANIPAIAFAVTGMETGTNEWDQEIGANRLTLLDWQQLRELAQHGVEIGSHSRNHRNLTLLDESERLEEIRQSARDMVAHGLARPEVFAYPFGERDPHCDATVEAAGYRSGFALGDTWCTPQSDLYNLPRVGMTAMDGPFRFWLKTTFLKLSLVFHWRVYLRRIRYWLWERLGIEPPPGGPAGA